MFTVVFTLFSIHKFFASDGHFTNSGKTKENNMRILWALFLSNLANVFVESLKTQESEIENKPVFQNCDHILWTKEGFTGDTEIITINNSYTNSLDFMEETFPSGVFEGNDSLSDEEFYDDDFLDLYELTNYTTIMQDMYIGSFNSMLMDVNFLVSMLACEVSEKKTEAKSQKSSDESPISRHLSVCLGILCNLVILNVFVSFISGDTNFSDALWECVPFIIS